MGGAVDWFEENIGNPLAENAPQIGASALVGGALGPLFGGAEAAGAAADGFGAADLAAMNASPEAFSGALSEGAATTGGGLSAEPFAEVNDFSVPEGAASNFPSGTPMADPFAGEPSVIGGTDQPPNLPDASPPIEGGADSSSSPAVGSNAGLVNAGNSAAATSAGSPTISTPDFGGLGGEDFGAIPGVNNSLSFSAPSAPSASFSSFPGTGGGGGGGGSDFSGMDTEWVNDKQRIMQEAASAAGGDTSPSTIASALLEKIKANPLTAAGLGLNLASGIAQRSAAAGIPGQIKELAKPSATISSDLLAKASSGALSPVASGLLQEAKTGPIAAQSENLIEQSKTGPAAAASNDLLTKYAKGEISPAQKFDIDTWKNQAIAQVKSQYAKAGISDSTAARRAVADIEAKAVAMADVARQGLLTSGLAALQGSTAIGAQALQAAQLAQNLTAQGLTAEQVNQRMIQMGLSAQQASEAMVISAITTQAQQDQQFAAAQSSALNSLMLLQALEKKAA